MNSDQTNHGAVVGCEGGVILGSWPLPTSGAGVDKAGTGPVGEVGPNGVMTVLGIFWTVVVVVVVVRLAGALLEL
jgi:hypothetical protein